MLHREGIQPSSLFLAVTTANLTSAWMKEQHWRKMTCCAVWREMSFMGYNTANGVIIYDHCILLFLSHPFLVVPALWWWRSHISPCYLHTAIIILRVPSHSHSFWYSTVFTIRGFAAHTKHRRRVMNKLSIRVKRESYSEVTCILLPF